MHPQALMELGEGYRAHGHALLEKLIDPETASRLVAQFITASPASGRSVGGKTDDRTAVRGAAVQVYGNRCSQLATFHWGLTPLISAVAGLELVPSYCVFRVYARGSTLLVHRDRPASEHGLSLTLACSDGAAWPFEVSDESSDGPSRLLPEWGDIAHRSFSMQVGDAVLYRATSHAHARTTPNPNNSTVHAFLFWVDPNGPQAEWRFDKRQAFQDAPAE